MALLPNMDGPPCEFYKTMWDTIGDDICCLVSEVFSSSRLFMFLNQGFIKLIPKNVARYTNEGWRPTSLRNLAYKIMAKEVAMKIHLVVIHS